VSALYNYDVTSVGLWLVLWQLCIARRPPDRGVYLRPGV